MFDAPTFKPVLITAPSTVNYQAPWFSCVLSWEYIPKYILAKFVKKTQKNPSALLIFYG